MNYRTKLLIKKFFAELAELFVSILPHYTIGFVVGYSLFSQIALTWYNVILVLGLCFMSGIGYLSIADIIRTNRRAKKTVFKVGR